MNDRERALQYLEPYTPLLGLSAANLVLKLNAAWSLPVALACILWSLAQGRRLRGRGSITRGIPLLK